jgi:hypothetical protein
MTQPEKFCRFLKNGLVYNNDTTHFTISPCCYFDQTYKITPGQSIDRQLWNNVDLTSACRVCLDLEKSGLHSYRQASFDQTTGTTDLVEFLTVAVNKKCNLACVSCDAKSSSFWYQENIRYNQTQLPEIHALHQEDRAGTTTSEFIKLLADTDLSQIKYIKFGGGEPLMSNTHEQIMQLIPHPEQVIIHYTSNFSLMPTAKTFELWKKFKLVKWVASLDGVEDQFEFLRWPYAWKKLVEFVPTALETAPGNVMFGVEHTINPLNVFYIDRFQTWFDQNLKTNRYGDQSDFNLHPCFGTIGLDKTPPGLRNVIEEKYGNNHSVVRMLNQHPYSGNTVELVNYLDTISQQRNLDWRTIFSEVEEFFNV